MLEPTRWDEVKEVVLAALDLPEEERSTYLDEACGDDEGLRSAAAALLAVSTEDADAFDHAQVAFTTPSPVHVPEGILIDDYRVIRHIGEGAMGAVYLAEDTKHDRQVALKVLSPRGMRFSRSEHKLLALLSHPNIATLFDSGTTDGGLPYLVMEYVAGEPLPTYCEKHCPTIESRLRLFLSICDAVAYAHQHLVIHRDLKPGNILVTADGVPKVVDFGIARRLPSDILATHTDSPHPPLTLAFASPEQLRKTAPATTSDIYSLGVILCTLLTGRLPYRGRDFLDLYSAIPSQEPEKPSILVLPSKEDQKPPSMWIGPQPPQSDTPRLARLLRGDLDAITLKALRKEPEKRYQTVGELADEIRRFLTNEPVAARKGSRRYRAWKFWRRHAAAVISAFVVFFALLGLALALAFQYRQTVHQRDRALLESTRAQETADFLATIFKQADPWENKGTTVTAQDLLESAKYRLQHELPGQPQLRVRLLDVLGVVSLNMGRQDEAVKLLSTALRTSEHMAPAENAATAEVLTHLGDAEIARGNYDEAASLYTRALQLRERLYESPNSLLASSLLNLGTAELRKGNLDIAATYYTQALAMSERLSDQALLSQALHNMGSLELNRGNYKEAASFYERALSLRRAVFTDLHPETATTMDNLAVSLSRLGEYDQAERHYREALRIRHKIFGTEHPSVASTMTSFGQLLVRRGKFAEAERLFRDALAIKKRNLPSPHPSLAASLNHIGALLQEQGNYLQAEMFFSSPW